MSTPILATKLYIPPPRPKVILRPRLIEQLNTGLQRKLTLISAPAGFGKTTLVSSWIYDLRFLIDDLRSEETTNDASAVKATREEPTASEHQSLVNRQSKIKNRVAWLSLDERDNDPTRFLTYLVAALQTIAANLGGGVVAALQSPQPPPTESILTTLLNEIATIPDDFVLVLDDYHLIDAAPNGGCPLGAPLGAVDQALTFLLDHLPPHLHLVIATREDPPLPLARYRARGQLTEVRASDLRFTPAEATDFLNQVMGLTLATEEIATLESRTEGWIAGLQLAALALQGTLALQGRTDTSAFIQAFTGDHHFILDYLVEEVLQHQPERVRSFLLQTSILDRLSGALCEAVTGQEAGGARLEALERDNLFVVPLDDKRQWYRYHHLFADMLQARALAEQPAQVPLCHQRASDWYAQHGLRADAIRHALAAKDFVRAAGLIELAWPEMDGRFQSATWLGWARALPAALVRARPVLSVAYGWALLNGGDLEGAEAHLQAGERWLEIGPSMGPDIEPAHSEMIIVDAAQFGTLPASIATARAYQSQARGDLPGSVKYGRQALDLLPADDHLRRGPAAALLALAQWASGDLESAYQNLAGAMTNFQKVGNLHFAISGTYGLADIRTAQGRLHDAIKIYTQVLQLALAQGKPLLRGTADLYMGLGELYREQGNLEAAREHLLKSEALGEQAGLPDWRYRFCRIQARFKETAGDLVGALDMLDAAERRYRRSPVPDVQPLAAMKTRVWVAQGRLREAQRWVQEQGLSVDDELSFLREFEHITLARVLIADGTLHEALRLLDRLQQAAAAGGRMGSVIEILVLQALAHQAQGNLAPALGVLARALRLAEPESYVRLFVDEGLPMARLLSAAVTHRMMPELIAVDYIEKLLAVFEGAMKDEGPMTKVPSLVVGPSSFVEPLSERELEVLRLLGSELNGPEIARRLMVSLNTMRTHTKNIYSKLGVNDRRAAVRRAQELGLD